MTLPQNAAWFVFDVAPSLLFPHIFNESIGMRSMGYVARILKIRYAYRNLVRSIAYITNLHQLKYANLSCTANSLPQCKVDQEENSQNTQGQGPLDRTHPV